MKILVSSRGIVQSVYMLKQYLQKAETNTLHKIYAHAHWEAPALLLLVNLHGLRVKHLQPVNCIESLTGFQLTEFLSAERFKKDDGKPMTSDENLAGKKVFGLAMLGSSGAAQKLLLCELHQPPAIRVSLPSTGPESVPDLPGP